MNKIKKLLFAECYIRTHFGIYCPGCGGTRAFLAIIHGHIIRSLQYNPIILLLIIDIILMKALNIIDKKNPNGRKILDYKIKYNVMLLILWVIYFIVRNYLLIIMNVDIVGDFIK